MRLMKSKRGSDYFSMMWNVILRMIVIFAFVFLPVYAFISALTTSEYFEKNYLALDLALVTDTVLASPNSLVYNYAKDTKDFSFDVRENKIQVYKKKNNILEGNMAKAYYIGDPLVEMYYSEIAPLYESTGKKDDSVIPVRLSIIKAGESVRYYNAKEELIDEQN